MDSAAERRRWADHLRRLALPVAMRRSPGDWLGLVDAAHRPGWLGTPLIARAIRLGLVPGVDHPAVGSRLAQLARPSNARDDVALWWDLLDDAGEGAPSRWVDVDAPGAIFDRDVYSAVEVWTEAELAGLHALGHRLRWMKAESGEARVAVAWGRRMARAVAWHVAHTQPDNATNHPWALHLFLRHGTAEARHFAEMLLSNCLVTHAEPDELSAWILLDAAQALADR